MDIKRLCLNRHQKIMNQFLSFRQNHGFRSLRIFNFQFKLNTKSIKPIYRLVFVFGGCLWCCINGNHQNSHYKCNFPHFLFGVYSLNLTRTIFSVDEYYVTHLHELIDELWAKIIKMYLLTPQFITQFLFSYRQFFSPKFPHDFTLIDVYTILCAQIGWM